jgi:hypothetical protein
MSGLLAKLAALRAADADRSVFGASAHDYQLAPALSAADLASAETQFGVPFPDDYRRFLLEVGAGGAGPSYGVFPLVHAAGAWGWDGDGGQLTGDLRTAFPHTAAWNLVGHPFWDDKPDEDDEDDEDFADRYEQWTTVKYAVYFDARWTAGAICLHHEGCALRNWLVVSGPERGHMWHDAMTDEEGLAPIAIGKRKRVTFTQWYEHWLDTSLASLRH